jgi:double-stranded uracil-DNA glycosylase
MSKHSRPRSYAGGGTPDHFPESRDASKVHQMRDPHIGTDISAAAPILPDLLAPGLRLWFVGTAAGPRSAAERAYYAHPGNRFWRTLHEVGVTPARLAPADYGALLELGVGLTDVCKTAWGVDARLPREAVDADGLMAKVETLRPSALAFTSKTAAAWALGRRPSTLGFGRQAAEAAPGVAVFVLPSPSGLATSHWRVEPWREVAEWLRDT